MTGGDLLQRALEPSAGLDAVHLAGLDERANTAPGTSALVVAREQRVCPMDEAAGFTLVDARGRKYLTGEERARFLAAARAHPRPVVQTFALTLAHTGCRISEALALRACDSGSPTCAGRPRPGKRPSGWSSSGTRRSSWQTSLRLSAGLSATVSCMSAIWRRVRRRPLNVVDLRLSIRGSIGLAPADGSSRAKDAAGGGSLLTLIRLLQPEQ